LLRQKRKKQRKKAIFGQLLRWPKKGSTLLSHRAYHRHGAGFIPMPNTIWLFIIVLSFLFLYSFVCRTYGKKGSINTRRYRFYPRVLFVFQLCCHLNKLRNRNSIFYARFRRKNCGIAAGNFGSRNLVVSP
jgi:hypothetical protein